MKLAIMLLLAADAGPALAERLTVLGWQAKVYRVTHRDEKGNFKHDKNYAFMLDDYEKARNGMVTGYDRALRQNRVEISAGKTPLFCPPAQYPELSSGDIYRYFNTLPIDYRKKTSMVDAMLGWAIQKFPCSTAAAR